MSGNQQTLMGKQAKRIVNHIRKHIHEYTVNLQIELTQQDLEDYQKRLKEVVRKTDSSGAQRITAWIYKLVQKIKQVRYQIREEKLKIQEQYGKKK